MGKEILHNLIDMVPDSDSDSDLLYHVLLKFIPSDIPTEDEIEAIRNVRESIEKDGTVSFDSIDWD